MLYHDFQARVIYGTYFMDSFPLDRSEMGLLTISPTFVMCSDWVIKDNQLEDLEQ